MEVLAREVEPRWRLPVDCWLDATFDELLGRQLSQAASSLAVVLYSLDPLQTNTIHLTPKTLATYLLALIRNFRWSKITLLSYPSSPLPSYLQEEIAVDSFPLPSDVSFEVVTALLTKEVKVWSSNVIVCAAAVTVCSSLLQAAQQNNMMKTNYAYILTHPPELLGHSVAGLIYVLERGVEQARSETQMEVMRIAYAVRANSSALQEADVWNSLETGLQPLSSDTAVFPGNSTVVPIVRKPRITLSIDRDLTNPTKAANTPYEDCLLAASLAISELPRFLPSHELIWENFTYGCTEFDKAYVEAALVEGVDRLGVAHMTAVGSSVTIGTLRTMAALNLTVPCIGSGSVAVVLANSTEFPYFVRTIVSNSYGATVYMTLFRYYGWKKVNFLYGNETYGIDFYQNVKAIADIYGIEIANREDLRAIDPYVTPETIGNYTAHLQELLSNNVRPLLCALLLPVPMYIFQALYDLGAREGDIIYFGEFSLEMFSYLADSEAKKAEEIGLGGVHLTAATYAGRVGKAALHSFERMFNFTPQTISCFYYDSVYSLAHTLKFLLYQGRDYEDPSVFMQALRKTRFTGCSGLVAFEGESNDRSFTEYVVSNFRGSSSAPELVQAGYYTPTKVQLFTFDTPIVWPGGSTEVPSNVVQSLLHCPFKDRDLHSFPLGKMLSGVLIAILTFLFVLSSLLISKKCWRIEPDLLTKKVLISVEDTLLMVEVGIEAVQYCGLGPNFERFNLPMYATAQLLSMGLDTVVTFAQGVYWVVLDVALGVCGLWALLIVYLLFRLDERLKSVVCVGNIGWIAWLVLPHLGSIGFIPLLSVLFSVFQCNSAVGPDPSSLSFNDSVLANDCYVHCWRGTHVAYLAGACVALLLYIPLAILFRPLWQTLDSELHIMTYPRFMLTKTIFQLLLVALYKAVFPANALIHGISYLLLLVLFWVLALKYPGFNYKRVSHWQRLSVVGVFWLGVVSMLGQQLAFVGSYWLVFVLVGWGLLVGAGLVWMWLKYPSLLVKPKGVDTQELFKFAFQFHVNNLAFVQKLNRRNLPVVSEQAVHITIVQTPPQIASEHVLLNGESTHAFH